MCDRTVLPRGKVSGTAFDFLHIQPNSPHSSLDRQSLPRPLQRRIRPPHGSQDVVHAVSQGAPQAGSQVPQAGSQVPHAPVPQWCAHPTRPLRERQITPSFARNPMDMMSPLNESTKPSSCEIDGCHLAPVEGDIHFDGLLLLNVLAGSSLDRHGQLVWAVADTLVRFDIAVAWADSVVAPADTAVADSVVVGIEGADAVG